VKNYSSPEEPITCQEQLATFERIGWMKNPKAF